MDLQSRVNEALNIAVNENGYDELISMVPSTIAFDISLYCSDLEDVDESELADCVKVWQKRGDGL